LAKGLEVNSLIIVGDSMIVIKPMIGKSSSMDRKLSEVISQAIKEAKQIGKISFYHAK